MTSLIVVVFLLGGCHAAAQVLKQLLEQQTDLLGKRR
jgi:hypothetical protein